MASKAANQPFPVLAGDDVIDFMIVEALNLKDLKEQRKAEKEAKIKEWKSDISSLRKEVGR